MTLLVTGGTGLIGNNVVRQSLERGEQVRVLVRSNRDPRPLADLDVEHVFGDITNPDQVTPAMAGVDCVVHSAAFLHIGSSRLELSRRINVDGTRNVAKAARLAGARMIHVSTVDTLGVGSKDRPADEETQFGEKVPCDYVISKREGEAQVKHQIREGLNAVIVHPTFALGPWDWKPSSGRMLLTIAKQFTPLAPSGGHTVTDARDIADGILRAIDCGVCGEHYILGGQQISYLDFWKLCAEVGGGKSPWGAAGPAMRFLGGRGGDLVTWLTGHEPDVNSAAVRLTSQFHYYSSAKAREELGYHYRDLDETVRSAWQWFRDHGYA